MKDFNFSLSNILFHSLLKDNRGALQFGCAVKLQKTQDKVYAIIGYVFLAGGRVQGLRGRPAGARPSGFHIKNQGNLSANIHGTRLTSSCMASDLPSVG